MIKLIWCGVFTKAGCELPRKPSTLIFRAKSIKKINEMIAEYIARVEEHNLILIDQEILRVEEE